MNISTQREGVRGRYGRCGARRGSGRRPFSRALCGALLVLVIASGGATAAKARQVATQDRGKVAARVNGEPIYESDIARNIRTDQFEDSAADQRRAKLEHLIMQRQVRQFLDAHK